MNEMVDILPQLQGHRELVKHVCEHFALAFRERFIAPNEGVLHSELWCEVDEVGATATQFIRTHTH